MVCIKYHIKYCATIVWKMYPFLYGIIPPYLHLCVHNATTLEHKSVSKSFNSPVGNVGDGKDMGGHLVPLLPLVDLNDLLRVDGQPLVRVHHHTEQARVGLVEKV